VYDPKKTIRDKFLPYGSQWIDETDIEAVVEVLKSDWLTTGPKIEEFETKLADYCGAQHAVAVANGTAALHAACFAAGISSGDEVITTPLTFAASANCVLYQGGEPVFADINPKTYNLDPDKIEEEITDDTKAIIPVDFTGQPCELDEIMELADQYNLTVIEDAAHALGAEYKGEKIGSIADMTTFSFHPVKQITSGEGGMILTDDEKLYQKLKQFRHHGITKDQFQLQSRNVGDWFYEQQELGYNYRLTDIQAALGIAQLEKLDYFIERRREIANLYNERFAILEEVTIPYQLPYISSSWHLYILKLNLAQLSVERKEIFAALKKEKLGVNVHYIPVYYHPYYQELGYEHGLCPEAEILYERIITLPLFPRMSNQDVDDVIKIVKRIIDYYSY
jgi:UDP-4-amino-4,6-dideoxy-N-acetyl-beta-L-altrosamine transaminase